MKTNCESYQMRLMDAYYGERTLNAKEKAHLEQCELCAEFWQTIQQVDHALEPIKMAASSEMNQVLPADVIDIRVAFNKAEAKQTAEKSTIHFLMFLSLAIMIVMAMIVPVLVGRADLFVTLQGILAIVAFLSIPLLLNLQKKRGNRHV